MKNKHNYIKEKLLSDQPLPIRLDDMKVIIEQMENCVCRIFEKNIFSGTGFFCKIPFPDTLNLLPVLITNNNVLNEERISLGKKISFTLNNEKKLISILIDKDRICYTNREYDITIIEIKLNDDLNINSFLEVDERTLFAEHSEEYFNKSIYLIYYRNEGKEENSFGIIKNIENYRIIHLCSTESGSAGGPILNLTNFKVIGVNCGAHSHKNFNVGVFIKNAINDFNKICQKYKKNILNTFNNSLNNNKINIINDNNNNVINDNKESEEIKKLKKQNQEANEEIKKLKNELEKANLKIKDLNTKLEEMKKNN